MEGEEFAVGCLLSVKTTLGDDFQAQIISYDRTSNFLVLHILIHYLSFFHSSFFLFITRTFVFFYLTCNGFFCLILFFNSLWIHRSQEGSKDSPKHNIRFLKANFIKEFTLLGQADDPLDFNHCRIDLNLVQAREDAAVRQAEIDMERMGIGVTYEAQIIFDALAKTLPVRWDKTVIVVMNEVRVSSPYLPENVSGGTSAANERVKKVIDFERKRLHNRTFSQ